MQINADVSIFRDMVIFMHAAENCLSALQLPTAMSRSPFPPPFPAPMAVSDTAVPGRINNSSNGSDSSSSGGGMLAGTSLIIAVVTASGRCLAAIRCFACRACSRCCTCSPQHACTDGFALACRIW